VLCQRCSQPGPWEDSAWARLLELDRSYKHLRCNHLTASKKITVGVGDKTSPKAGAAGMLYFDDIGAGHPAN